MVDTINSAQSRYEFRAFAQNFGLVGDRIRNRSVCELYRESRETYILSRENSRNNTKIRNDSMDIKVLLKQVAGLEQWSPRMKARFPLTASTIRDEVFAAFGTSAPSLERPYYTPDQFIEEVVRPHRELGTAAVFKRRYGFTVNDCITEIAELLVNGAAIMTVAVESEDRQAVLRTREMLGLDAYENVNYLLAIKRIIGMEPLPQRKQI